MKPPVVPTDAELSPEELVARRARLAATRQQVQAAQATNANRNAQALARERAWLKRYDKGTP